ncbi:mevalonate kinase family protein [Thiomicrorhabdus cannonii]|uniref:mevalonate kinase family protein n=1 Tax=Thiomicrorhabdus cannonii TaxID=2748011 RepID=UPI0015BAAFBE|nr:GHMP kinase [Thiomicrorhabdus cannonii]
MSAAETTMKSHCTVPAKLILSGEHAVLYHCPALSLAIQLPTRCALTFTPADSLIFNLQLPDLQCAAQCDEAAWQAQVDAIEQRFQAFRQNHLSIKAVLTSPEQLIWITLAVFKRHYALNVGQWHLQLHSETPMGRGLGSSAAVIVATLAALFHAHQLSLESDKLLEMAQHIEHYQHGRSSGIDPATLLTPGLLRFKLGEKPHPLDHSEFKHLQAWLIDTGAPQSSTGECVSAVRQFADDSALWQNFAAVSAQIEQAWLAQDETALKTALNANHQLLCQIGVVPAKVSGFIERLNRQYQAAAKICGAGSISGDNAGIVLCLSAQPPKQLCEQYGYRFFAMQPDSRGVHCEMV